MPAIKQCTFPYRISAGQLSALYSSPEDAFARHDFIYAARYSDKNSELRGCALLMLGNRVGGERILDRAGIHSGKSCFYRAYAAWQDDDLPGARRWIAKAKEAGFRDSRLGRLEALMEQKSFKVLFHWDIHNVRLLEPFKALPDTEIFVTRQFPVEGVRTLPFGQPLPAVLPEGFRPDLVVLDDLKMVPVGIGNTGAPVIALVHDIEWYYDLLPKVLPEIDLLSVGASSQAVEAGRTFGATCVTCFFPAHMGLPGFSVFESLKNLRTRDLFYSGSLTHDFYRYKKQAILPLAQLDKNFSVDIEDQFYPPDQFWHKMRQSRFSFSAFRDVGNISSRSMEAVACGTIYLAREDDAAPYVFCKPYACFQTYRNGSSIADVEKHLGNYDSLIDTFRRQLPEFEAEFRSFLPLDPVKRAQRYVRFALFMTHVEGGRQHKKPETKRNAVYINEYDRLARIPPEPVMQYIEQLQETEYLRRAFAIKSLLLTQKKTTEEGVGAAKQIIQEALQKRPDSLVLQFVAGLCQAQSGNQDIADGLFKKIIDGDLQLEAGDPAPVDFGSLNSFYWIGDARIRGRCKDVEALVAEKQVWISYAWANRAGIAFDRKNFTDAAEYARKSLELFPYNEDVQRIYLRTVFALSADKEQAEEFLRSFENACHNDYSIRHDFAAPAYHLLIKAGRESEAQKLLEDVQLCLSRIKLDSRHTPLYEEFMQYNQQYGIPHSALSR